MWPLLDFGYYCRFWILDVGRLLRVLDTNGRFFGFWTLVADFGFWTLVADFGFWTVVTDFGFRH